MQNVKSWRKLFGIFKGKKFSLISTSPPPPTIEPRGLFSGVVLAKHSSLNTHSFLLEPIKHQRPQIPTYLHSCVMCWLVICTPSRRHHYILPITTFRQLCWILLIWSVHWNILFDKMQPLRFFTKITYFDSVGELMLKTAPDHVSGDGVPPF